MYNCAYDPNCQECEKLKEEMNLLNAEAFELRFIAEEFATSAKDLLDLEQKYAARIQYLKEKSIEYKNLANYNKNMYEDCKKCCSNTYKYKNINKCNCYICYNNKPLNYDFTCEDYNEKSQEYLFNEKALNNLISRLNNEREFMQNLAMAAMSDINTLNSEAAKKEFDAITAKIEYEKCLVECKKK